MDQVGKFYPMKWKYRHDCSIIPGAFPKCSHPQNHPCYSDFPWNKPSSYWGYRDSMDWFSWENLQETIDFFPLNMGFSCKLSLKPIHWAMETPIEIPWFPHGNISRNSAVAWRRTSTSSVSADPLDMWSRYLARQQRRATGGSWKWSTKWWLMVDKWWNMVISGD